MSDLFNSGQFIPTLEQLREGSVYGDEDKPGSTREEMQAKLLAPSETIYEAYKRALQEMEKPDVGIPTEAYVKRLVAGGGSPGGGMSRELYDPQLKATDIFQYADDAVANIKVETDEAMSEIIDGPREVWGGVNTYVHTYEPNGASSIHKLIGVGDNIKFFPTTGNENGDTWFLGSDSSSLEEIIVRQPSGGALLPRSLVVGVPQLGVLNRNKTPKELTLVGVAGGIEMGSNSNGQYYKFSDGLLICTKKIALTSVACTTASGGLYRSNIINAGPLAADFVGTPNVQVTLGAGDTYAMLAMQDTSDVNALTLYVMRGASGTISNLSVFVSATGTWR